MTNDLFDDLPPDPELAETPIAPGAVLLHGFAHSQACALLHALNSITAQAPLRHMQTPGGHTMTVGTTSCGALGWVSDPHGYRYAARHPDSGNPWPAMPACLADLAQRAAAQAGYANFAPNACLINQYVPGAKLTLHQDKNEKDFTAPIVSVSLGLPAVFCLAPWTGASARSAGGWCMATWWFGAGRRGWLFMVCSRSPRARTRYSGDGAST